MKKSVWPYHTGNMENATESRRNRDGFPTDFLSEFCQGDIPSQLRRDSVAFSILFHIRCLGGDRVQKKILSRKFILSMLNVGVFESQF